MSNWIEVTNRVRFTARVQRVEALLHAEGDDRFEWVATGFPVLGLHYGIVVLRGHIVVKRHGCWGQVAVDGTVVGSAFEGDADAREFALTHTPRFVEAVYETARRALEMNAVLLDSDFDLPRAIPSTGMELMEPATVERLQAEGILAPGLVPPRQDLDAKVVGE